MSEHAAPTLALTLFGGFEARASTGALLRFRTSKARALVAYLALEANTHHGRSKLATLLWGNAEEDRARDSLRHALGDVRRALASLPRSPLVVSPNAVAGRVFRAYPRRACTLGRSSSRAAHGVSLAVWMLQSIARHSRAASKSDHSAVNR
jgi:hypothetical protein